MEEQRADLKTELKWIFYNRKFMIFCFFVLFTSFMIGFFIGLDKGFNSCLELAERFLNVELNVDWDVVNSIIRRYL
ncbi:MAG: hypothetical protein AABY22_36925 [Nanoarchaeota archaeon]